MKTGWSAVGGLYQVINNGLLTVTILLPAMKPGYLHLMKMAQQNM
jgi:hypothetical protein